LPPLSPDRQPITMTTKRPVTHKDIARQLGISQSTVSRALDSAHRHLISAAVVEKVLKLSEESGFQGNILARRLRNRRTETITLIIPSTVFRAPRNIDFEIGNHLLPWRQVAGHMQAANQAGYDVKLVPQAGTTPADDAALFAQVGFPHSDGVVFCGHTTVPSDLSPLQHRGVPYIITSTFPKDELRPLVSFDQTPGIQAALEHLFSLGHRRVACLAFALDFTTSDLWAPRYNTWLTTMKKAGYYDPSLMIQCPTEQGLRALLANSASKLPFTAVYCANDITAHRLVKELIHLGIRVPTDVAVVGFDNNILFHHVVPRLSTVEMPLETLGRRASEALIQAIEGKATIPELLLLPTTFERHDTA
jgi:DNA-binding LacI/PurR family transcriptional regulator